MNCSKSKFPFLHRAQTSYKTQIVLCFFFCILDNKVDTLNLSLREARKQGGKRQKRQRDRETERKEGRKRGREEWRGGEGRGGLPCPRRN